MFGHINMENLTLYKLFDIYLLNYHGNDNTKYNLILLIQKIKNYLKDMPLLELTTDKLQEYFNYLYYIEQYKDSTIYTVYKHINIILNYAIKKKYIENNPCKNITIKKIYYNRRIVDYSKKYIRKILKTFKKTNLYAFVFINLHTGLRRGEMLALNKNNILFKRILFWNFPIKLIVKNNLVYNNLSRKKITKSTKTNKVRIIHLDLYCSLFLYFYLKTLKSTNLFDFVPNTLTNNFHKIVKGKLDLRITDLRHIHASYLLAHLHNNANCIKIVQERLGHSNILQTFNTYAHVLQTDQKRAIRCLNFI